MKKKVTTKPTERIAAASLSVGIAAGAALHFLVADIHWGVSLAVTLLVMGACYQAIIELVAKERLVDRDHGHQ